MMSKHRTPLWLACLVLVALAALSSPGATDPTPSRTADREAAHREMEEVVERFFLLSEERDWDGIGKLMAPEFAIYTDGATIFGRDDYIDLLKADDLVVERWELRDLETSVAEGADMGWCRYRGVFHTTTHGERQDVETAETLILEKRGGAWKIVQAHASIKALADGHEDETSETARHGS